ncbi:DNA-binding protein [Cordyceps javanica]|uniref:DNA-binding protein n=1 Tax=Cordyceps javanica TaxID=43265 RepID=A0A545UYK7_9HYPO|nr:DNA-binding protein [Cordyceps javanica]TQW06432.1 DNA-binding protein [Cordyceps javanica]
MKDAKEVIQEFNELVNMTASELETWLQSDDSGEAGWPKDNGGEETVGHESGRKITEILKSNPSKDPQKYNDDQISHMRKVVAYCKRHLAQEEQSLKNKSESEAKKTKSYISLKNWGHDPLKKSGDKTSSKESGKKEAKEDDQAKDDDGDDGDDGEQSDKETGDKRKSNDKAGAPEPKKHRTRQNSKEEDSGSKEEADKNGDDDKGGEDEEAADETSRDEAKDNDNSKSTSSSKGPKPGETVSWNWGNGQPEGKVLDVKEEKATITTKRGSKVSRDGSEKDPAVILDTGKSKAIKSAHELN